MTAPPSFRYTDCSLASPSEESFTISFQWSSSFNLLHVVDRYNVRVTPDPFNCSSDQVPPSAVYKCSGEVGARRYYVTVSSINCGDREGEGDDFILVPQLLRKFIVSESVAMIPLPISFCRTIIELYWKCVSCMHYDSVPICK